MPTGCARRAAPRPSSRTGSSTSRSCGPRSGRANSVLNRVHVFRPKLATVANPTQHRLSPVELRVLGCLLEKQRTTPDQYPLSLNSLRLACNQSSNREPVMSLDEDEVRAAVHSLSSAGWVRLASGAGSRAAKYRQLFDESLDLLPSESSLLAMLFLRGPQTVNELRTRTARAHAFADNDQVAQALGGLAQVELVHELPREPGKRETRWTHLLAAEERAAPSLEDVID